MTKTLRIALVDDHPLFLQGVRDVLKDTIEFEVIGCGATLHEAVALAQNFSPDVMLIDINIPGNGFEAAKLILRMHHDIKIVMLTASDRLDHVKFAMEHGILGYVVKGAEAEELFRCLRSVGGGKRFITPELAARMVGGEDPEDLNGTGASLNNFTGREREVVNLLAKGQTNKEIADILGLSEKTVKHHMSVVMEKLGVRNRVEAALMLTRMIESAEIRA